ncbi:MAG: ParB N-terminal domain-containing protein [Planctomycetes bacterium]|nr:ParB N-terminal domain-containing protein [Planctomycetota bacterium]
MTPLRFERLPIERLVPAPYNPRVTLTPGTAAWRKLERSLDEFGLVQPIVWNERTGHVVGGHQRLAILKHRGCLEVEAAVVSLPLEREKALNIALNNPAVGGRWDGDKLAGLVEELCDLPDFDATLTGFDAAELRDLLLAPAEWDADEEDGEDAQERVRVELLIDPEDWESVRPEIDSLAARHNLEVHFVE